MQRENRIFASKTAFIFKFANFISVSHCIITICVKSGQFHPFFLGKKRGENREKSGRTIGAFSKYLRILGEVS